MIYFSLKSNFRPKKIDLLARRCNWADGNCVDRSYARQTASQSIMITRFCLAPTEKNAAVQGKIEYIYELSYMLIFGIIDISEHFLIHRLAVDSTVKRQRRYNL